MQVGEGFQSLCRLQNRGLIIKRKEAGHNVWSVTLTLSYSQKHFLVVSPREQEGRATYPLHESRPGILAL